MRTDYCVYTHLRPDGTVFYVGKGIPTRPYRKNMRSSAWSNEVKRIGSYSVSIDSTGMTENDAFLREIALIKSLKENGCTLVNLTRGGDGCKELVFTEEIKLKLKKARAQQKPPMLGKKTSKETKEKISMALSGENHYLYGKTISEETRAKLKLRPVNKFWSGKNMSETHRKKMSDAHKNLPSLECPYCHKVGGFSGMKVHHFDNCKRLVII